MKKYLVKWGKWDASSAEVPGHSVMDAIQTACKKYNISESIINSVTLLGSW